MGTADEGVPTLPEIQLRTLQGAVAGFLRNVTILPYGDPPNGRQRLDGTVSYRGMPIDWPTFVGF
jgi:hypothetical protein